MTLTTSKEALSSCPDLEQILTTLRSAESFVLVSHIGPDSDAYGSSCALALSLRAVGKDVTLCNISGVREGHTFIPGIDTLEETLPKAEHDTVLVVLDCGDRKRVGDEWVDGLSSYSTVINIDHHNSNDLFGTLNLVLSDKCSTCEIVFDLLSALEFPIDQDVATCLLTGIMGDTGRFRYPSTTDHTFDVAAALVRMGASPSLIANHLYGSKKLATVKLESMAFHAMELLGDDRIALLTVTPEMYEESGGSASGTDGFAEAARDILGVDVSAFIRFDGDLWKVSMRSVDAAFDVSAVARDFGGGGHKQAAAFRWWDDLETLKTRLSERLLKLL